MELLPGVDPTIASAKGRQYVRLCGCLIAGTHASCGSVITVGASGSRKLICRATSALSLLVWVATGVEGEGPS
eukprot:scaffold14472_cov115-Isochrysis_galbana.AAC.6